ncbi:MAG: hypothetical protein AMXMBFR23_03280 [Chloroflexota bacterium]
MNTTTVLMGSRPGTTRAVLMPVALATDPHVSAEAVRLWARLASGTPWEAEVHGRLAWEEGHPLALREELEARGWLVVARGEGVTVLVLMLTRNADPLEAVRQAFPQGIPGLQDGPHGPTDGASAHPAASRPLQGFGEAA